jgi:hypothetical protein
MFLGWLEPTRTVGCRETALPLEELWQRTAEVFEPVTGLPSPPLDLRARQQWLKQAMQGTWRELHDLAPPGSLDYLVVALGREMDTTVLAGPDMKRMYGRPPSADGAA